MNEQILKKLVVEIFTEGQLSELTRSRLKEMQLNVEQVNFLRNCAFDEIYSKVSSNIDKTRASIRILEQLLKLLSSKTATLVSTSQAFFTPSDSCLQQINLQLSKAQKTIDICVFTIADDRISDEIIKAHQRGVKVRIITDDEKSFDAGSDIERLKDKGISIRMDNSPSHMHHKFAIFDNTILLNGSFNWTRSASEHNQENITVTDDLRLIATYQDTFNKLWQQFSIH